MIDSPIYTVRWARILHFLCTMLQWSRGSI